MEKIVHFFLSQQNHLQASGLPEERQPAPGKTLIGDGEGLLQIGTGHIGSRLAAPDDTVTEAERQMIGCRVECHREKDVTVPGKGIPIVQIYVFMNEHHKFIPLAEGQRQLIVAGTHCGELPEGIAFAGTIEKHINMGLLGASGMKNNAVLILLPETSAEVGGEAVHFP